MAECLIALGSNLGDRGAILRDALTALSRTPGVHLVARSRWHETPAVGGPEGQGEFLNGAALVATTLDARVVHAELVAIEQRLGRVRTERWAARTLDLDLLLFGSECSYDSESVLEVPHPRMHWRRFVLAPAADVVPWMVHPTSGWTVSQLLRQFDAGNNEAAITGTDTAMVDELVANLNRKLEGGGAALRVRPWSGGGWNPGPRVLMAIEPPKLAAGTSDLQRRKMLSLPAAGPVAWLGSDSLRSLTSDAWTVLASAFPMLAC